MQFKPSAESKALYNRISKGGLSRSAERIWSAAETMARTCPGSPMTVSSIGRLCQEMFGGPKAQSIRNQRSTLKALVERLQKDHFPGDTANSRRKDSERISNALIAEELTYLQNSNNRLRSIISTLGPFQLSSDSSGLPTLTAASTLDTAPFALSEAEHDAISRLLSPSFHQALGLKKDKNGNLRFGRRVLIERPVLEFLGRIQKSFN